MPMPSLPAPEIPLPGEFVGPQLAATPERWTLELEPLVRNELARVLAALARGDDEAPLVVATHAALERVTARVLALLGEGPGFALVRGVPVEGHSRDVVGRLFTIMGRALGQPQAQNLEGELLTDVRDIGADPRDIDVRLYKTAAEQDFHTDGADVIGLCCLQTAKSGGESRLVSSVRVVRSVCAAWPELAPLLFEPWWFQLPGGPARGLPPALPRPIASFDGRKLETFFIGWYIRNAQGLPGVPPLDDARRELLGHFEATANDPALYLDMPFVPGDVQWLRNAFVLHKRRAYVDHDDPARKRHLLRLWLATRRFADAMPRFDQGGGVRG